MSDRAPYSRVYWSVMDDAKFDGIREDVRMFGSWSVLLIVADMAWPAPAYLPPTVPKACVNRLAGVELIDILPGGRFRIHGLNNERGRRSDMARASATARHSQTERDADADRTHTGRNPNGVLDETRRDETKTSRANARDEPHIEAWLQAKYRLPTDRQRAFLDRYLSVFDVTGPQRMARIILEHSDDPIAALKADLDRHREERLTELSNGHAPEPRPKPKREPWQDLLRDKLAADEEALQERTRLPGVPS